MTCFIRHRNSLIRIYKSFLVSMLIQYFAFSTLASAVSLEVGLDYNYSSIHSALEDANANDTILIHSGRYKEFDIVIDKPLSIIGDNLPIIDGNNQGQVITVQANNVLIEGIQIWRSRLSFMDDFSGILIKDCRNVTVRSCIFNENYFALYLANSAQCTVENNTITGKAESETTSGNGIHLWYCRDIEIKSNITSGHRDGIYFEFVKFSKIINNVSRNNLRYGLHFMFSDSCVYSDNEFRNNGAGVAVMYTHYIKMTGNKFFDNWGSSSYGLMLKEISDSEISDNYFYQNSIAIYAEGSSRVNFHDNDIVNNGWGLKIMSNSMDNEFHNNNFDGNSFQVTTYGRQNFNNFDGNYWSDYSGYDINGDKIGDVPHRPMKLFALQIQRHPEGLALLHSLFVKILDFAENLIPTLTPETLVDNKPKMVPVYDKDRSFK